MNAAMNLLDDLIHKASNAMESPSATLSTSTAAFECRSSIDLVVNVYVCNNSWTDHCRIWSDLAVTNKFNHFQEIQEIKRYWPYGKDDAYQYLSSASKTFRERVNIVAYNTMRNWLYGVFAIGLELDVCGVITDFYVGQIYSKSDELPPYIGVFDAEYFVLNEVPEWWYGTDDDYRHLMSSDFKIFVADDEPRPLSGGWDATIYFGGSATMNYKYLGGNLSTK